MVNPIHVSTPVHKLCTSQLYSLKLYNFIQKLILFNNKLYADGEVNWDYLTTFTEPEENNIVYYNNYNKHTVVYNYYKLQCVIGILATEKCHIRTHVF